LEASSLVLGIKRGIELKEGMRMVCGRSEGVGVNL